MRVSYNNNNCLDGMSIGSKRWVEKRNSPFFMKREIYLFSPREEYFQWWRIDINTTTHPLSFLIPKQWFSRWYSWNLAWNAFSLSIAISLLKVYDRSVFLICHIVYVVLYLCYSMIIVFFLFFSFNFFFSGDLSV